MYFCGRYQQEKSQKPYVFAKSISACLYRKMIYLWSLSIYFHSLFLLCVFGGREVNHRHHNLFSFQTYFSQMLLFL